MARTSLDYIWFGKRQSIEVDKILRFRCEDKVTIAYQKAGKPILLPTKGAQNEAINSVASLMEEFAPDFVMLKRGHAVRLSEITDIRNAKNPTNTVERVVTLSNGEQFKTSRRESLVVHKRHREFQLANNPEQAADAPAARA